MKSHHFFKDSVNTFVKGLSIYLLILAFVVVGYNANSQTTPDWNPNLTPGGANSVLFKFTKQVWLNPTIILTKQRFEEETRAKLLILPRFNDNDTSAKRIEKAFDAVLSFLVYKENTEGSIKFYFDPKNKLKPFSFGTSEELWCKFSLLQKDTVEQLLNAPLANSSNLDNFSALPFDSIISRTSQYCKRILLSKPGPCGTDPENDFTLSQLNCVPARLSFEKVDQSTLLTNGGVDEQKYPSLAQYYNSVTDLSDKSNYPIAWKAVAAGKNDVIRIKVTKKEKDFVFSKLVFKNSSGTETYNTSFDGSDSTIITLSIAGKSAGSMLEVLANYTNGAGQSYVIGAFNIFFYEPRQLTLKVWDVDETKINTTRIEEELNKIYGNVFIKWRVENITCKSKLPTTINREIRVENSGLLSNYMDDMKPIINYFKENCSGYDSQSEDIYYMILGCTNDKGLSGYMPRARNLGFAFNNDPHTIAHELGHGAFGLKHIFSAEELGEGCKYQTNNLMDYSDGTTSIVQNSLYKHQWDLIHDPDFVGWFEGDDEEAELKDNCNEYGVATTLKAIADRAVACDGAVDDDFEKYITDATGKAELKKMCVAQRIRLIKCIADGTMVDDEDEMSINEILLSTPADQIDRLLVALKTTKLGDEPLWMALISEFDQDVNVQGLNKLFCFFTDKKSQSYAVSEAKSKVVVYGHTDDTFRAEIYTEYLQSSRISIESDGKITIEGMYFHHFPPNISSAPGQEFSKITVDPFEDICVVLLGQKCADELTENGFEVVDNKYVRMPACLWVYISQQAHKKLLTNAYLNVFVSVIASQGLGQFQLYKGIARSVMLAADVIYGVNSIVNTASCREALAKADPSGKFYYYWDKVNLISTGAYVTVFAPKFVKGCVETFKSIRVSLKEKLPAKDFEEIEGAIAKLDDAAINGSNGWLSKLGDLGLTALKNQVEQLDELARSKFIDDFANASDDALKAMDENASLLSYWKTNGDVIKARVYPNAKYKLWDDTKNAILSSGKEIDKKILNAIENAPAPNPNSQKVMAGAYSPDLPNSQVVIKYNTNNFDVSTLEPELQRHLEYLKLIKNDYEKGGKLFQKLYTGVPEEKMMTANIPGMHAEVLATNEVIKQLKYAKKFNGIEDLKKIHVLVKGKVSSRGFENMCRCPHCYQIIDNVNIIGNE
ncbi:MAG TPA: hypothetical protein PLL00_10120 [Bacteroidia bacterium]|nr:hypothetical protein [Bacteroidia bacterium]